MEFIPPLPSNIPKMVAGWCLLAGVFHPRCLTNQWGTPKLGFDTICFLIFSRWATNFVSLPTPAPPQTKKRGKRRQTSPFFAFLALKVFCFYWTLGVMRTMPAEVTPVNLPERLFVLIFMFFALSAFATWDIWQWTCRGDRNWAIWFWST